MQQGPNRKGASAQALGRRAALSEQRLLDLLKVLRFERDGPCLDSQLSGRSPMPSTAAWVGCGTLPPGSAPALVRRG